MTFELILGPYIQQLFELSLEDIILYYFHAYLFVVLVKAITGNDIKTNSFNWNFNTLFVLLTTFTFIYINKLLLGAQGTIFFSIQFLVIDMFIFGLGLILVKKLIKIFFKRIHKLGNINFFRQKYQNVFDSREVKLKTDEFEEKTKDFLNKFKQHQEIFVLNNIILLVIIFHHIMNFNLIVTPMIFIITLYVENSLIKELVNEFKIRRKHTFVNFTIFAK